MHPWSGRNPMSRHCHLPIRPQAPPTTWRMLPFLPWPAGGGAGAQSVGGAAARLVRATTASAAPAATGEGTHDLADCLQLAFQGQPRIAAARSSLAAAEESKRAIDNLRIPDVIDRELPYRRKQASLGVAAAAAGVDRQQREPIYPVSPTYFTLLYAPSHDR